MQQVHQIQRSSGEAYTSTAKNIKHLDHFGQTEEVFRGVRRLGKLAHKLASAAGGQVSGNFASFRAASTETQVERIQLHSSQAQR